jgi:ATP-dependent DNA ligase
MATGSSRNGCDYTSWNPLIVEAAHRIRTRRFILDGEAVLLGVDGISVRQALQRATQRRDPAPDPELKKPASSRLQIPIPGDLS